MNPIKLFFSRFFNNPKDTHIIRSVSFMLFVDSIGTGIILPILPQLFFNPDLGFIISDTANSRAFFYSLVLSTSPLSNFFGMSFFGRLSDKLGRKKPLIIAVAFLAITYGISALAIIYRSLLLFCISRGMIGFLGGIYSMGNALVSDISGRAKANRTLSFRLPALMEKLGLCIGPALSVFVVANHFISNPLATPFMVALLLGVINFFWIFCSLLNFRERRNHKPSPTRENASFLDTMGMVLRKKHIIFLVGSYFLFQMSSSLVQQGMTLYLMLHFNYTVAQLGMFSSVMCFMLVFSLYSSSPVLKKHNPTEILSSGIKILFVFFIGITIMHALHLTFLFDSLHSVIPLWVISGLFFTISPLARLSYTTLFSERAPADVQGLIMGIMGQLASLSYFLSALLVGHIVLHRLLIRCESILLLLAFCLLKLDTIRHTPSHGSF